MGPFTFNPGDIQEMDFAFSAANGWAGTDSSIDELLQIIDSLLAKAERGEIIFSGNELGIKENRQGQFQVKLYPDPCTSKITIHLINSDSEPKAYRIYNLSGTECFSGPLDKGGITDILTGWLNPGFYFIVIETKKGIYTRKFIKM
jgi:hypothetical protein